MRVARAMSLGAAILLSAPAMAQCPVAYVQKFGAPVPSTNRSFGDELALDGDVLFVGSQFDDYLCPGESDCDAGSVEVFRLEAGDWTWSQRLTPSQAEAHEFFSRSITLDANRALIGAYGHDTDAGNNSGYVYDFRFDGNQWSEHGILEASDRGAGDWFGWDVAMEGTIAAVGAQSADGVGAVYVFRFTNDEWVEEQKLSPELGAGSALFGHSLAMEGGRILVGANVADGTGAAYIYVHDGQAWVLDQKLVPPLGIAGDRFGEYVAIRSSYLLVSATDENGGAAESGAVHVYWFDGADWLHTHRLVPSDPLQDAAFGGTLALGKNFAIVDATLQNDIGESAGQAYAFLFNGMSWSEVARLRPAEVDEIDHFGSAVAIDGGQVLIGARGDDDPCGGGICLAGAVYVFDALSNCNRNAEFDFCEIESGQAADCNANFVPDSCEIASGASSDCDENGVPDSCDIAAGDDCNDNGVPDSCDVAQGASDCNANGLPDSCEPYAAPAGEQKRWEQPPVASDGYGSAVAVLNDVAVVGAPFGDSQGVDAGSAAVLRRDGNDWTHEATLLGNDITPSDYFGFAVAAELDVVFVGAYQVPTAGTVCGAVYVYEHDGLGWTQRQKIVASDYLSAMQFGRSVAACGELLVVGAPRDGEAGFGQRGAAYVFRYDGTTWLQEQKLLAPVFAAGDNFGYAVAIDGDVIVVGEYLDDDVNLNAGAGHVFRFDGQAWMHEAKLSYPAAAAHDQIGWSVAVNGGVAAIGSLRGTVGGQAVGAVYVYRNDGLAWPLEEVLVADDARALSWLGSSTAIVGDTVLAGAYAADVGPLRAGAAYLFQQDAGQWSQRAKLTSSDGAPSDQFGFAVSFDGRAVAAGAPYEDEGAADGGAAYFYELPTGAPIVTRQPSSLRVAVAARAAFAVTAVGAGPLSFRWQKDGVNLDDGPQLSGATTARLLISSTALGDAAQYRCVVSGDCGEATSREATLWLDSVIAAPESAAAARLTLAQNHPNPFNPATSIRFDAPRRGPVALRIYSLRGELVATLLEQEVTAGPQFVEWRGVDAHGSAVASGVYLCRLSGFGQEVTRSLTLLR